MGGTLRAAHGALPWTAGTIFLNQPATLDEEAISSTHKPVSRVRLRNMQKFILKLLLTSLVFRRGSKRIEGAQLVASLLTLVVIISVGLYVWAHRLY